MKPTTTYLVGQSFEHPTWGKYIIKRNIPAHQLENGKLVKRSVIIEFERTGHTTHVLVANLRKGKIRDYLQSLVYKKGVSFRGAAQKYYREYRLWVAILKRTIKENKEHCYRDCTLHPRWLIFQNFLEDLPKLSNYKLWKSHNAQGRNPWEIDKDKLVPGNREYGPETCMFLLSSTNQMMGGITSQSRFGVKVRSLHTGRIYLSISSASRACGLSDSTIRRHIRGEVAHPKFEKVEENTRSVKIL